MISHAYRFDLFHSMWYWLICLEHQYPSYVLVCFAKDLKIEVVYCKDSYNGDPINILIIFIVKKIYHM